MATTPSEREPTQWERETGEVDPDDPYEDKATEDEWRSFLGPLYPKA